jgi:hypothetical protein
VLVCSGDQMGLTKFVQASVTMGMFVVPVTVKPKRLVRTPKLSPLVYTCGFHSTAGRPPNVAPQPVVPGK